MATRIRLARGGSKKRPYYRVVVADQRAKRDGRFLERIGSYNPLLAEGKCTIDRARAEYWLSVGALPSERVTKLFQISGIEVRPVLLPRRAFFRGGAPAPAPDKTAAAPEAPKAKAKAEPAAEATPEAAEEKAKAEAKPATEATPEATEEKAKVEAKPTAEAAEETEG